MFFQNSLYAKKDDENKYQNENEKKSDSARISGKYFTKGDGIVHGFLLLGEK
jgi:hypothetical protein